MNVHSEANDTHTLRKATLTTTTPVNSSALNPNLTSLRVIEHKNGLKIKKKEEKRKKETNRRPDGTAIL